MSQPVTFLPFVLQIISVFRYLSKRSHFLPIHFTFCFLLEIHIQSFSINLVIYIKCFKSLKCFKCSTAIQTQLINNLFLNVTFNLPVNSIFFLYKEIFATANLTIIFYTASVVCQCGTQDSLLFCLLFLSRFILMLQHSNTFSSFLIFSLLCFINIYGHTIVFLYKLNTSNMFDDISSFVNRIAICSAYVIDSTSCPTITNPLVLLKDSSIILYDILELLNIYILLHFTTHTAQLVQPMIIYLLNSSGDKQYLRPPALPLCHTPFTLTFISWFICKFRIRFMLC